MTNSSNVKKKRKVVKPKWSKDNPHPKHLEDPEHFTYLGKPRCQGRNPVTGKQCTRTATIKGEFCSTHTDVAELASKRNFQKFDQLAPKVVQLLRQGYTMTTAAARVGIQPRTITAWRKKGKEEFATGREGKFAKFWDESEQARIYACSLVENALFSAAMNGNVSAMIRYLECRMPDIWNAKRALEINVETRHRLDIDYHFDAKDLSDDELRAKIKEIAKAVEVSVGENVDDARLEPIEVKALEVSNA